MLIILSAEYCFGLLTRQFAQVITNQTLASCNVDIISVQFVQRLTPNREFIFLPPSPLSLPFSQFEIEILNRLIHFIKLLNLLTEIHVDCWMMTTIMVEGKENCPFPRYKRIGKHNRWLEKETTMRINEEVSLRLRNDSQEASVVAMNLCSVREDVGILRSNSFDAHQHRVQSQST